MLVSVSVVSAHLAETHKRWKLEAHLNDQGDITGPRDARFEDRPAATPPPLTWAKEGFRLLPDDPHDFGPVYDDTSRFGGHMYVLDLESGNVPWRSAWGEYVATPSAHCFDGDMMYVSDLEGSNVFAVDMKSAPGRIVRRISNPLFNDVHYLVRTRRGLLVASTGLDLAVEVDLDGNTLYQWWAGEHGFTHTPDGIERPVKRGLDHRSSFYHTRYHTTHLNAARYRDAEERFLLILLWRQGMVVEIDTHAPAAEQTPRVILDGLTHPHSLRPLPGGAWLIADSQGARLIELDADLQVAREIPSATGWIQDAIALPGDRWLIADVNRFRLVVQDAGGNVLQVYPYDPDWRVYGLNEVPEALVPALTPERAIAAR